MSDLSTSLGVEQSFLREGSVVKRLFRAGEKTYVEELDSTRSDLDAPKDFFVSRLSNEIRRPDIGAAKRLTYIDLFCGGGGLSLGAHQALQMLGFNPKLLAAVDIDPIALKLVNTHFEPLISRSKSVDELIRYDVDLSGHLDDFVVQPEVTDTQIAQFRGKVQLLVGGPPCQGHSNLNNRTRRFDPRNLLYFVMPAFAVALKIPLVVIENVRSINQASEDVVGITKAIFKRHGYHVAEAVLNSSDFGVAQSRSRHFLVASRLAVPQLELACEAMRVPPLSFNDACGAMVSLPKKLSFLEQNGTLSDENVSRINYLHEHNLFELPNAERPICHQEKHTYPSVYGRIRGELPMTTITTGFGSPGRGRYIHPRERRVINIREAGRLQSFPEMYWQHAIEANFKKANFQKIIGDAVPPLLAYPVLSSIWNSLEHI